jgi:hypothetical protein
MKPLAVAAQLLPLGKSVLPMRPELHPAKAAGGSASSPQTTTNATHNC